MICAGPIRGKFSRYIGSGPDEPGRGLWSSKWPQWLNNRRFISIFINCWRVFKCKIHLDFWWNFISGFIGPQILNFERSLSLKAVLFRLAKCFWEVLNMCFRVSVLSYILRIWHSIGCSCECKKEYGDYTIATMSTGIHP